MKERLRRLSTWLNKSKLTSSANEVDMLIKTSTVSGMRSLGIPTEAAKVFTEIIGPKWDYQIIKWWLQSLGYEKYPKEVDRAWSTYSKEFSIIIMNCLELLKELKQVPDEKKFEVYFTKKYSQSREYIYLTQRIDEKERQEAFWQSELYPPNEKIDYYLEEMRETLKKEIKSFMTSDFFTELLANKSLNKNQCKNLNMTEAINLYNEEFKLKTMPVVLDLGEYRWVNAGTGLSEFVRTKMKNCGRSNWGGLRAKDRNGNQMLLLLDSHNNPHVIATWNANFVDSYDEDSGEKRYMGGIEGVGSSKVKPEYYESVKALFEQLKPNTTSFHDSRDLMNYLGASEGEVKPYPEVKMPKGDVWL